MNFPKCSWCESGSLPKYDTTDGLKLCASCEKIAQTVHQNFKVTLEALRHEVEKQRATAEVKALTLAYAQSDGYWAQYDHKVTLEDFGRQLKVFLWHIDAHKEVHPKS